MTHCAGGPASSCVGSELCRCNSDFGELLMLVIVGLAIALARYGEVAAVRKSPRPVGIRPLMRDITTERVIAPGGTVGIFRGARRYVLRTPLIRYGDAVNVEVIVQFLSRLTFREAAWLFPFFFTLHV